MSLLFKRVKDEQLAQSLEEEGVWDLLENSATFLQGVGLLAR